MAINKKLIVFVALFFPFLYTSLAQDVISGTNWKLNLDGEGHIEHLIFYSQLQNDTIPFFKNKNAGPTFYVDTFAHSSWTRNAQNKFTTKIDQVECHMNYISYKDLPAIEITLKNTGHVPFQPQKAGIKLGVDTYMDSYPEWFNKYFPTYMCCEHSHFYGYMQNPNGEVLTLYSPNPIASWSVDYNLGYQDPAPYWFMGHRIESINLDLLNALPLPNHHPQDLWQLKQNEEKKWIIVLGNLSLVDDFSESMSRKYAIPMLEMSQTSFPVNEKLSFSLYAKSPKLSILSDKKTNIPYKLVDEGDGYYKVTTKLPETGLYKVILSSNGKVTEGCLTAHTSWEWCLKKAREASLIYHQKATSHAESWYGFYSAFLAARYFPDKKLDKQTSQRFEYLFDLLHDEAPLAPKYYASRIQNTSTTIGLLVDKYQAFGDRDDLYRASILADWLIDNYQRQDGAYVNHNTVYTSVIYVAKSILELVEAEQQLAEEDREWYSKAERHFSSATKAINQLIDAQGNFETEGELTFEDGMISCSALQIGKLALMQKDPLKKQQYTIAMLKILESHNCLTQLYVPDARRRGGTMRYWEAQYDVQMLPNMFNSPHGWSGWRAYATYYAYLLTGNEKWLMQTFNAMGAFSNLIDYKTGQLRWAFVVDPHLKVEQACEADTYFTADSVSFGNPHPKLYPTKKFVIGEQYINMISDWQTINTQDNDVHELFKCMSETVLTNAFVVEREDGELVGYNCSVKRLGKKKYEVIPNESQITHLHCNLNSAIKLRFLKRTRQLSENFIDWF